MGATGSTTGAAMGMAAAGAVGAAMAGAAAGEGGRDPRALLPRTGAQLLASVKAELTPTASAMHHDHRTWNLQYQRPS